MSADKEPTSIDIHVGKRIRIRRSLLRVSQEKLGGVTAGMNLPAGFKMPF